MKVEVVLFSNSMIGQNYSLLTKNNNCLLFVFYKLGITAYDCLGK